MPTSFSITASAPPPLGQYHSFHPLKTPFPQVATRPALRQPSSVCLNVTLVYLPFFPLNLFETSVLPTPPNPHSPLPMPFPGAQELLRGGRQNQDTNMQNYVFARGQLQGACATDARLLKTTVAFMTRNEKAARSS